jgi:hypothetical protein
MGPKSEDRDKTGDRSDVRQEYVRLRGSPNRFRACQADGRQPFMRHEYLTMPVFSALSLRFARSEADAAAFRRARVRRLSSSDESLCQSSGHLSRILRNLFRYVGCQNQRASPLSLRERIGKGVAGEDCGGALRQRRRNRMHCHRNRTE